MSKETKIKVEEVFINEKEHERIKKLEKIIISIIKKNEKIII
ncbi:hypothetical protein [Thermohalobacter berrensis]|nr:hypothetical protein [Thermohalobacter berrensis]